MYIFFKKDARFFLYTSFFAFIFSLGMFYVFLEKYIEYTLIYYCKNTLHCVFEGTIKKEGFLFPKIIIQNPLVRPFDEKEVWYWKASSIECSFSFFHILPPFNLPTTLLIKDWHGSWEVHEEQNLFSVYNIFINSHIKKGFFEPIITSVVMSNAQLDVMYNAQYKSSIFFQNRIYLIDDDFNLITTIVEGNFFSHSNKIFDHYSGIIQYSKVKNKPKITVQTKMFDPRTGDTFYIRGSYEEDHGRFSLQSTNPNVFINPIIITENFSKISGNIPLLFLQKLFNIDLNIDAHCRMQLSFDHHANVWQGFLVLEHGIFFKNPIFHSAKIEIKSSLNQLFGPLSIKSSYGQFEGNYFYNYKDNSGSLSLKCARETPLLLFGDFFPLYCKNIYCSLSFQNYYVHIKTNCTFIDSLKRISYEADIQTKIDLAKGITCSGLFDNDINVLGVYVWDRTKKGFLEIHDRSNDTLFLLKINQLVPQSIIFTGYAKNIFLKHLCALRYQTNLFYDEGVFCFKGSTGGQKMHLDCSFQDGTFNFPIVPNLFSQATSSVVIDTKNQAISIEKIHATGATGTLVIEEGSITYEKDKAVSTCYIPATFSRCVFTYYPFLTLTASMDLLLTKQKNEHYYFLKNNVLIHDGFIQNVFQLKDFMHNNSSSFFSQYPVEHSMHICTENPIKMRTGEINAQVVIDMISKGLLSNPQFFGSISCAEGELLFPYKPLFISKAHLLFSGSLQNANLEIFAKNTIKNYFISMHAGGTLDHYSLFFDATPHLTKSQIISLLMFGTTEGSLGVFMPSLFSPRLKLGSFDIHFTPGFSDKSARGGIRGALEIAVNNRLHATILKNFTLSEDTRFEFSYDVSDAVSVRAIRDERRDIAGEIEMRWKF